MFVMKDLSNTSVPVVFSDVEDPERRPATCSCWVEDGPASLGKNHWRSWSLEVHKQEHKAL